MQLLVRPLLIGLASLALACTQQPQPNAADPIESPDAAERFLAAWDRERGAEYALAGVLTRSVPDGPAITLATVRARRGDRELRQIGRAASVRVLDSEPRLISCHQADRSEFLCTNPQPLRAASQEHAAIATALDSYTAAPAPTPTSADGIGTGATCWRLTQVTEVRRDGWGTSSLVCYEDGTGALIAKTTVAGTRTESFVTKRFSPAPSDGDLDPVPNLVP